MTILALLSSPWAIQPEVLTELQQMYAARMRGERRDIEAVEAQLGRPLANQQPAYELRPGGVAVLRADGVMAPKSNVLMQVSGGISTQMLTQQFNAAQADPSVRAVVFAASSPGGNVVGIPEASRALEALATAKPTVTVAEGPLASAMYWVGSAANAIYAHGETDPIGSIGVYARLGWEAAEPNRLELMRGKYKRLSINGQAPDPDVLAHHEGQLDYLYTLFVDTVAAHRGVSASTVLDRMADGKVFYGQQAIDARLIDGISTVDAMVQRLAVRPEEFARKGAARPAATAAAGPRGGRPPLTRQQQADAAHRLAIEHRCSFVEACVRLGIDSPGSTDEAITARAVQFGLV